MKMVKLIKLLFGKDNDEKLDNIVLNTVKNWKFKPGYKRRQKC